MDIKLIVGTILVAIAGLIPTLGPALHLDGTMQGVVAAVLGGIAMALGVKVPSSEHKAEVADLQAQNDRLKELK